MGVNPASAQAYIQGLEDELASVHRTVALNAKGSGAALGALEREKAELSDTVTELKVSLREAREVASDALAKAASAKADADAAGRAVQKLGSDLADANLALDHEQKASAALRRKVSAIVETAKQ